MQPSTKHPGLLYIGPDAARLSGFHLSEWLYYDPATRTFYFWIWKPDMRDMVLDPAPPEIRQTLPAYILAQCALAAGP